MIFAGYYRLADVLTRLVGETGGKYQSRVHARSVFIAIPEVARSKGR